MLSRSRKKKALTDSEVESGGGETSEVKRGGGNKMRKRASGVSKTSTASSRKSNFPEDEVAKPRFTESEEVGGVNTSSPEHSRKGRRKEATVTPSSIATASSSWAPVKLPPQLMGFVCERDMDKYAQEMGLKKLTLEDLCSHSNLNNSYVGGQVLSHFSRNYGHFGIYVQDESAAQPSQSKHLLINFEVPLAMQLPSLSSDAKVFVHRACVTEDERTCSQDHNKCLLVSGQEARVWIVHKDVNDPVFFSRAPCGKRWWKRSKKTRERLQAKWSVNKQSLEPSSNRGNSSVCDAEGQTKSGGDPTRQTATTGSEQASQESSSSSFPINADFPTSAIAQEGSSSSSSSSDADSDTEWTRRNQYSQKGPQPALRHYVYKKLADLIVGEKKQNIICIVREYTPPAPSQGSDSYSLLTLVDESEPENGIRAVFFNKDPKKLPQVHRIGDVICVHRIEARTFNRRIQVEGGAYCSVIRFSGEVGKKVRPYTGSVSFTLTAMERERVRELRRWARKRRVESDLRSLQSVYPSSHHDLLCQVVGVTISKVPLCMVLSIWDGTPCTLNRRKITMEKNYDEGYPEVREDRGLSEKSMGYCVDVVVYSKRSMRKLRNLCPGKFLYLRNVHCAVVNEAENMVELRVCRRDTGGKGSWVDSEVVKSPRVDVLDGRGALSSTLEDQLARTATPITSTPHSSQALTAIADVVCCGNDSLVAKFRCRVKVASVNASCIEDLVSVYCSRCGMYQHLEHDMEMDVDGNCTTPCPRCSSSLRASETHEAAATSATISPPATDHSSCRRPPPPLSRSCQFYFTMTLMDASGELRVHVAHQQAMELFGGLKPNNFYQYQQLRLRLNGLLYGLTGGTRSPFTTANGVAVAMVAGTDLEHRGGTGGGCRELGPQPWVECCIIAVKEEDSGTIQFCIFGTSLIQQSN